MKTHFPTLTEITGIVEGTYERLISDHITKISWMPSTIHRIPGRDTPDLKIKKEKLPTLHFLRVVKN